MSALEAGACALAEVVNCACETEEEARSLISAWNAAQETFPAALHLFPASCGPHEAPDHTSEDERDGQSDKILDRLVRAVESEPFLEKLQASICAIEHQHCYPDVVVPKSFLLPENKAVAAGDAPLEIERDTGATQQATADGPAEPSEHAEGAQPSTRGSTERHSVDSDYVYVDDEELVSSMAAFIAAHLAQDPRSRNMKPADLQKAVKIAVEELQKSRLQRLWSWGKFAWRTGAATLGAFHAFSNPWIVRGMLQCLYLIGRLGLPGS
ncbi:unnamed protein product [Pedinophyceae sp. YPF-701]|nr:unnamed protein product [Pedinophyceae sp. YPF-701]